MIGEKCAEDSDCQTSGGFKCSDGVCIGNNSLGLLDVWGNIMSYHTVVFRQFLNIYS